MDFVAVTVQNHLFIGENPIENPPYVLQECSYCTPTYNLCF